MTVFLTGATGYMGCELIPRLLAHGHQVKALARQGAERKLPPGCEVERGDALNAASYRDQIAPADTFVHLVGAPHPAPWKGKQFRAVDLVSIREAVPAAAAAGIRHFVYLGVAQPAPIMKDYLEVRAEGERLLRASGMNAPSCGRGTCSVPAITGRTCCCRAIGWESCCLPRVRAPAALAWSRSTRCLPHWSPP